MKRLKINFSAHSTHVSIKRINRLMKCTEISIRNTHSYV